jgi:hypothetical protein
MTAIAPPQPQIIYPSSDGEPVLELEVQRRLAAETQAEQERQRAEQERQRAEQELQRAEQEHERAEALEVLLEQYRSQFGELPGHPTTES